MFELKTREAANASDPASKPAFYAGVAADLRALLEGERDPIANAANLAALVYHTLNGIRHLVWDFGYGFEKTRAERTGTIVIALSVILTIAIWAYVFLVGGSN